MLLSTAELRLAVAERLARGFPDRRDPARITRTLADMIRARSCRSMSTTPTNAGRKCASCFEATLINGGESHASVTDGATHHGRHAQVWKQAPPTGTLLTKVVDR
jgi:hypothetical protein